MNKFGKFISIKKNKIGVSFFTSVVALSLPVIANASTDVTSSMTTAMNSIKTDTLAAISAVAPIGIGIMGAFLVWKYGIKFFKSIAK